MWRGAPLRSFSGAVGSASREIEEAIERHTRISREHLTPELRLHLLTPDCPLYGAPADEPAGAQPTRYFEEPFWSIYWPGGQALARYVLDEGPRLFRELAAIRGSDAARQCANSKVKVLDIGTGCGAAAIAAKIAGAGDVLANDIDEVACVAALKNARLNGVEIRTSTRDLLQTNISNIPANSPPRERFDLVLVGDLLYDEATAARLVTWLDEAADPQRDNAGALCLLADPGRHGLTAALRRRLLHLRTYPLAEHARRENHGYAEAAVWRFLPRG